MDVTVCICTHDRPGYLSKCLEGLRRQTVGAERFDILVVDSASSGGVPAQIERMVRDIGNARLLRVEQAGISLARNVGAAEAHCDYIAYIDDDAVPAPDWVESILEAIGEADPPPALIGGRILPDWEAPLPWWWPPSLRGSLSIIEVEAKGEYRSAALPPGLEPYGANMVIRRAALRAIGGFGPHSGRIGEALLSDEEVQLAWRLQAAGHSARYDPQIVVRHQIQATRLTPEWLLSRLYWHGISTVRTRRLLGRPGDVWHELPRRLAVATLLSPAGLLPRRSTRLVPCRWRLAYAFGFIRGALDWRAAARRCCWPSPDVRVC
jgi:glucosyl-dolichyl phosphate glucuronosyltransferase